MSKSRGFPPAGWVQKTSVGRAPPFSAFTCCLLSFPPPVVCGCWFPALFFVCPCAASEAVFPPKPQAPNPYGKGKNINRRPAPFNAEKFYLRRTENLRKTNRRHVSRKSLRVFPRFSARFGCAVFRGFFLCRSPCFFFKFHRAYKTNVSQQPDLKT